MKKTIVYIGRPGDVMKRPIFGFVEDYLEL